MTTPEGQGDRGPRKIQFNDAIHTDAAIVGELSSTTANGHSAAEIWDMNSSEKACQIAHKDLSHTNKQVGCRGALSLLETLTTQT